MTENALATAIGSTVTSITGSFGAILGWWFIPIVVALFGAGIAIGLVLKFFGRRSRGRRR